MSNPTGLPRPLRSASLLQAVRDADSTHLSEKRKGKVTIELNYDETGTARTWKVFTDRAGEIEVPA